MNDNALKLNSSHGRVQGPRPFAAHAQAVHTGRAGFAWRLALLPALVLLIAPSTLAQEYLSDQVDGSVAGYRFEAGRSAERPDFYAQQENKQKSADYFQKYFFPSMTRYDDVALAELQRKRDDLFRRYLKPDASPQFRSDVTKLTYDYLAKKIIVGNYHPAVKYNAILILGMLDDGYRGGQPTPHSGANRGLTSIVQGGLQGNPLATAELMLGALVGLERHARYRQQLSPQQIQAMTAAALAVVNANDVPQGESPEVQSWVKYRAASVLAELGSPGADNSVHEALVGLIGDSTLELDDRTAVAEMLAKLNYQGAEGIDTAAAAKGLVDLAVAVAEAEDEEAQEFLDAWRLNSSSVESPTLGRERLLARLSQLGTGLQALPGLPQEAQVDAVLRAIGPLFTSAQKSSNPDLQIAQEVRTMANGVRQAASMAPRAAAAAPESDIQ